MGMDTNMDTDLLVVRLAARGLCVLKLHPKLCHGTPQLRECSWILLGETIRWRGSLAAALV